MDTARSQFLEAFVALAEVVERELHLDEKKGEYYYEEITVKRWVLGDGGVSGNCEICNENAESGWIDMDGIFLGSGDEDVDEPPAHPNCTCTVEYKDTRRRVYI